MPYCKFLKILDNVQSISNDVLFNRDDALLILRSSPLWMMKGGFILFVHYLEILALKVAFLTDGEEVKEQKSMSNDVEVRKLKMC